MIKMSIDEIIIEKGLRHSYEAKKVGVDDETLISWRKSKTFPRLDQAVKLAEILGVEITELYTVEKAI